MQQFFNQTSESTSRVSIHPTWEYVQAGLSRNLNTLLKYYTVRPYSVKSNHILARLLNSLGAPMGNLERFYNIVDAKALNLGMSFKFTSAIHRGMLHDGIFYGPGCKEIIIATNDAFSPYKVTRNWKEAQAVKVLLHPRSDLDLHLPTGRTTGVEKGLAVIAVNIPMLAVQFRAFLKEQVAKQESIGNSPLRVGQFIHMYVLPNMMPSHLDGVLFNRSFNLLKGAPMGQATVNHHYTWIDYASKCDRALGYFIDRCRSADTNYEVMMDSFPMINVPNLREYARLPEQAPTRQLAWAEVLARLKVVDWLSSISPRAGEQKDAADNNYFIKEFIRHKSDSTFENVLDNDTYYETIRTIKEFAMRCRPANNAIRTW